MNRIHHIIPKLVQIVGAEGVLTASADLTAYSYDGTSSWRSMPEAVVLPSSTEQVAAVMQLAYDRDIPVTVRGAGTNLSGGTVPVAGGAVLLTNGLKTIIEINEADMYAVVQPGVVTAHLAAAVEAKGLFYPPDPGSQAVSTLGGNVAENAGGLRGLKYGVTRDYVMGLHFFDVDGNLVKTGSRTVKCATGYNLTGLMVGSEGTLGVFARIILKLIPYPVHRKAIMAVFPGLAQASASVAAIIAQRIVPATLEFMDNFTIRAVEDFSHAGLPRGAAAMLLIELDGHPTQVEEDATRVEALCRSQGAASLRVARDDAERDRVWTARRSALSALAKLKPTLVLEDATVPRSQIPAMVAAIERIADRHQVQIGTFGHAGDGNLHPTILTDKRDKAEWQRVEAAIDAIFDEALKLGGTLSGEHGTGVAKARYLEKETSTGTIRYSGRLKRALDPNNILNPGKIITSERA